MWNRLGPGQERSRCAQVLVVVLPLFAFVAFPFGKFDFLSAGAFLLLGFAGLGFLIRLVLTTFF